MRSEGSGKCPKCLPGWHTPAETDQPSDIPRTIHTFDPCSICTTHVVNAEGNDPAEIATGSKKYISQIQEVLHQRGGGRQI